MLTAEDIIKEKGGTIISVAPDTTIKETLKVMTENKIGGILIKEEERFVGIWTERDLLRNSLVDGFDITVAKVGDYMVTDLEVAKHDTTIFNLMDIFLGRRLRHLPVENNGVFIGMLTIGDVIKANLNEKTKELESMNSVINWDYYENWQW